MPESELSEFSLPVSDADDIEFTGEELGSASDVFEDINGRARTENMAFYRTQGGQYVVGRSVEYPEDVTRDEVFIYENAEVCRKRIKSDLGKTNAAKRIYEIASEEGIDVKAARRIE